MATFAAGAAWAHRPRSLTLLEPQWPQLIRDAARRHGPPLDGEGATIAEERSPDAVAHVNLDAEALRLVIVPLADLGDARKQQRKGKGDRPLVEALGARAQPQPAALVHPQVEVHRQMLVAAEIIHDAAAPLAPDHVRVEAAHAARVEGADPGDRLAAEAIREGVVLDGERDVAAALREHDAPPRADIEEGQRVGRAVPELVHHAGADGGQAALAGQVEAALDLRVQPLEIRAERTLIDRHHAPTLPLGACAGSGARRGAPRPPDSPPAPARRPPG